MPEQQKMGWEVFIPIIAQYGLPLAEKLWTKLISGNPPSKEDWDDLRADTYQLALDRMTKVLLDQGIAPDSEQGKLFLALASKA